MKRTDKFFEVSRVARLVRHDSAGALDKAVGDDDITSGTLFADFLAEPLDEGLVFLRVHLTLSLLFLVRHFVAKLESHFGDILEFKTSDRQLIQFQ